MTRPSFPYEGDETNFAAGRYATEDREAFRDWLVETEGLGFAQANAISKQAREYYVGDTGTVTRRPHRDRVNAFAALRLERRQARIPLSIGAKNTDAIIKNNPQKGIRRRLQSGDADLENVAIYLIEAGIEEISFISLEGDFAYAVVGGESL
jgi:hypothetical protein